MHYNSSTTSSILRLLMPSLLILSILELHLYRLPQAVAGTAQKGSEILLSMAHPWGTLTHALAASITAAALVLVATNRQHRSAAGSYLLPIFIFALLSASIFQIAVSSPASTRALQLTSILLVGYMVARFLCLEEGLPQKIVLTLLALYQLIPRFVLLTDPSLRHAMSGIPTNATRLLTTAELIMTVALIALIPAYGRSFVTITTRKKIRAVIVPSAIALLLMKLYLDDPSAMSLTVTRSSGLQLILPVPFYIATVWSLIFTAIILRSSFDATLLNRQDQVPASMRGYALAFIFLSGFLLINPYQHLLSGLGFTLLGMKNHLETA